MQMTYSFFFRSDCRVTIQNKKGNKKKKTQGKLGNEINGSSNVVVKGRFHILFVHTTNILYYYTAIFYSLAMFVCSICACKWCVSARIRIHFFFGTSYTGNIVLLLWLLCRIYVAEIVQSLLSLVYTYVFVFIYIHLRLYIEELMILVVLIGAEQCSWSPPSPHIY